MGLRCQRLPSLCVVSVCTATAADVIQAEHEECGVQVCTEAAGCGMQHVPCRCLLQCASYCQSQSQDNLRRQIGRRIVTTVFIVACQRALDVCLALCC